MGLTTIDWVIMAVYFAFVLGIGAALKRYMKTSADFFLAGRSIPAWVCGLAFISANLGAQEVIGMGRPRAQHRLVTRHLSLFRPPPALGLFGLFIIPFYYLSQDPPVPAEPPPPVDEK